MDKLGLYSWRPEGEVCRRNAEDDTNFVAAIAMRIERDGFVFVKRTDGSHWIGEKSGVARPIVIPEYSEIGLDIIQTNMRTARMSRERYFTLLRE